MNREQAKEFIKNNISCLDYLQPAPNHSGSTGYICPYCGSGSHSAHSTGAVKYYPAGNLFYCHACNKGGDIIDLYRAQTGADFNEALNTLAAVVNIEIDKTAAAGRQTSAQDDFNDENDTQDDEQKKTLKNENKSPADYSVYYEICRDRLKDPAALTYLKARGITSQTAAACGIGYDPAADPANAPGAIRDEYKAHPAPRIIAPCSNDFYIARSIDPQTPAAFKAPNPRGSRTQLFNAEAIHSDAPGVFVCEGIFDALSIIQAGGAAIATNGKGNGSLLIKHLQEHPAPGAAFVIIPDNDSDPQTAADTVKRAEALKRDLQRAGHKTIIYNAAGAAHDANDALIKEPAAFAENIAAALAALEHEKHRTVISDFLEKIQTTAYKPHATGVNFFDDLLCGGIRAQTLLLLMATPGAGKTTLCQQIAETVAEHGQPVIYFNFEMSTEQMLAKAISSKGYRGNGLNMSMDDILQGYKWTDEQRAGVLKTAAEYEQENAPFISYNPDGVSANLDEVIEYLNRKGQEARAQGKTPPAAFIDYIHLLTTDDKIDTAELIKRAVTGLKQYAINFDTFVIGIIPTNREGAKKALTLESGRDSSNLEFTADLELALNYTAIERRGKNNKTAANPDNPDDMERLKLQQPRQMTIRVLKTRGIAVKPATDVSYDTVHNIFYGTCREFEEVHDAPLFEEAQPV